MPPVSAIYLKSPRSEDIKTDIPKCQIHKYTNTNVWALKHPFAPVFNPWKRNSKQVLFWDTLMYIDECNKNK